MRGVLSRIVCHSVKTFLKPERMTTSISSNSLCTKLPKDVAPIEERPKVELHVHIDGSVRPESVWEIAKERGLPLPAPTAADLKKMCYIPLDKHQTLTEFLQKFELFMPIIGGHTGAIKRMAYEFCEDLAKDKIIYAEARIAPHLLANSIEHRLYGIPKGDLTPKMVVDTVLAGLREGMRDFNVKVNLILCCMRHMPAWSSEVLDMCIDFRDQGVVGIDIAGDENLTKLCPTQKKHIEVFQEAKRQGIHRTVHAGENGPAENVREAVYDMFAERVGHGYHATQDEELYRKLLHDNIHFEVCPYSSIVTGSVAPDYHTHPVHRMAEDGANFSVNTDDPTITGSYLLGEYKFAKEVLKVSEKNLLISNLNAARSSFLPPDEKKELLDTLRTEYKDELQFFDLTV